MPNFCYLQSLILPVWSGTLAQKQDELAETDVSLPISDWLLPKFECGAPTIGSYFALGDGVTSTSSAIRAEHCKAEATPS